MTPVGPDVIENKNGSPSIERASVRHRTTVSETSLIPPVDVTYTEQNKNQEHMTHANKPPSSGHSHGLSVPLEGF
jgi:hypothetical protein